MESWEEFWFKIKEFFKTVLYSQFPKKYHELSQRPIKTAVEYLLSLLLVSFIVMGVLAVPKYLLLPQYIDNQFEKINTFTVDIDLETNESVKFTEKDPQLTIDTSPNATLEEGRVLITDEIFYLKNFNKISEYKFDDYKNLKDNPEFVKKMFLFILIMTLPSVAIISYFGFFFKFIAEIILLSLIAFVILRMAKHTTKLRDIFVAGIYASTIMVVLDILAIPYSLGKYLINVPILFFGINIISLLLFLILFILALIIITSKEM